MKFIIAIVLAAFLFVPAANAGFQIFWTDGPETPIDNYVLTLENLSDGTSNEINVASGDPRLSTVNGQKALDLNAADFGLVEGKQYRIVVQPESNGNRGFGTDWLNWTHKETRAIVIFPTITFEKSMQQ